jgi:hypothetical protein
MEPFKGYSKMLNNKYFDRDGKALTEEEWQEKVTDIEYQRVGVFETLANGEKISVATIWLGMNQSFVPTEDPIIFETMVFGGRNNGLSKRYSTELEALVGHNEIVDIVQDTLY